MMIRFDSDVGGFTTFRDVAVKLLELSGHSGTIPGAILAPDLAAALERLQGAIADEPRAPANDDEDGDSEPPVGLRQRAFPLIELMRNAAANDSSVRWREA